MVASYRQVLVVDDDPMVRELLYDFLTAADHEVTSVADGEEGIQAAREFEFPVIVTDLVMPRANGFDLIDRLQEMRVRSKVIIMTGHGGMEEAIKALADKGAFHFLRKPVKDLAEVQLLVQRAAEAFSAEIERDRLLQDLQHANHLAITDGLTGLYTHRHFYERLSEEIDLARRHPSAFSLLFVDVDHFKRVNDQFGHPAGDACLRTLAQVLRRHVRATDYIARYGGEEIAILLPQTSGAEALELANRLREEMERVWVEGIPRITVSIGIADYPFCAKDGSALVAAADTALLQAKYRGRNRAVYFGLDTVADTDESIEGWSARLQGSAWAVVEEIARHGRGPTLSLSFARDLDVGLKAAAQRLELSSRESSGALQAFRMHDLGGAIITRIRATESTRNGHSSHEADRRHGPLPDCSGNCLPELTIRLLEAVSDIGLAIEAIRYHRERWDGAGPTGIQGDSIPPVARLLSIAEAYRAAVASMPMPRRSEIKQKMLELAGSTLDPIAVDAFIAALDK